MPRPTHLAAPTVACDSGVHGPSPWRGDLICSACGYLGRVDPLRPRPPADCPVCGRAFSPRSGEDEDFTARVVCGPCAAAVLRAVDVDAPPRAAPPRAPAAA